MHDVEDELRVLGRFEVPQPSDETVAADVRRGTRALRRLRTVQAGVAAGVVVVAAASGLALTGHEAQPDPVRLGLVAYHGRQAPGFTVTTVPRGYVVQGVSGSVLAIARPEDRTPITDFEGKLTVTIEPTAEIGPQDGRAVDVDGAAGTIGQSDGGVTTLSYAHGVDTVVIESWNDLGLDEDEVVRFAEGLTVTAAAQESHG